MNNDYYSVDLVGANCDDHGNYTQHYSLIGSIKR